MSIRSVVRNLYGRSPQGVKTAISRLYASFPNRWHFGKDYDWATSIIERCEKWSIEELSEYQDKQLKKLLSRASEIPVYNEKGSIVDITEIIPINKDGLREYSDNVKKQDIVRFKAESVYTGGSTGEPLKVYLDKKGLALQKATRVLHDRLITKMRNPRQVQFRGARLDPILPGDSIYAVKNFRGNILYLNSFTISKETANEFYTAWNNFKPELIFAYPSTLATFASFARMDNKNIHSPKAIITSSETLKSDQRNLVEAVLGTSIHDFYGLSECECIAFEKGDDGYTVDAHVCYVELLVGDRPAEPGELAEIVITHLHNYSLPILRYRTNDYAIGSENGQLPNGGWFKLSSINGRAQENLIAYDGTIMSIASFNMHTDYWIGVLAYQIIQIKPGEVHLKLKVATGLSGKQKELIENEVSEKFRGRMKFKLDLVNRLYRTQRGKTPLVLSIDLVKDYDFNQLKQD